MNCDHEYFETSVSVRKVDTGRFLAEVKIKCGQCQQEFEFYGLAKKLNLNGATVSNNGKVAYLAIGTPETLAEYYRLSTKSLLPKAQNGHRHETYSHNNHALLGSSPDAGRVDAGSQGSKRS